MLEALLWLPLVYYLLGGLGLGLVKLSVRTRSQKVTRVKHLWRDLLAPATVLIPNDAAGVMRRELMLDDLQGLWRCCTPSRDMPMSGRQRYEYQPGQVLPLPAGVSPHEAFVSTPVLFFQPRRAFVVNCLDRRAELDEAIRVELNRAAVRLQNQGLQASPPRPAQQDAVHIGMDLAAPGTESLTALHVATQAAEPVAAE